MAYRVIITTTLSGRRRVQFKSTGHNGGHIKRLAKKRKAAEKAKVSMKE